jgi:hypothetical protein
MDYESEAFVEDADARRGRLGRESQDTCSIVSAPPIVRK